MIYTKNKFIFSIIRIYKYMLGLQNGTPSYNKYIMEVSGDIPKGFDETIGAVPLGFLLCLLTLMAGNIWIAFLVHVAMAWTNSLTALKHHPDIHYSKWQKNAS